MRRLFEAKGNHGVAPAPTLGRASSTWSASNVGGAVSTRPTAVGLAQGPEPGRRAATPRLIHYRGIAPFDMPGGSSPEGGARRGLRLQWAGMAIVGQEDLIKLRSTLT